MTFRLGLNMDDFGSVSSHMENLFIQACSGTSHTGVFLELFSGVGRVAAALRHHDAPALEFEINKGAVFDVCNRHVLKVLCSWIVHGKVNGIWFGTPCTTWSIACKPAVRDLEHIWGRPNLPAHRLPSLELGNKTLQATCRLIKLCILHLIPCILENPDTSMIFKAPPLVQLAKHSCSSVARCCMCAFGARWRKHTKVLGWHINLDAFCLPLCCGPKGVCIYSNRKHIVLSGHSAETGKSWTSIASAYPRRFAETAAGCLLEAGAQRLDHKRLQIITA